MAVPAARSSDVTTPFSLQVDEIACLVNVESDRHMAVARRGGRVRLTGRTWSASRRGPDASIGLDVDERWKPRRLPWLMRLVTSVVPAFRRWPTTYRWQAELGLDPPATVSARWMRTATERGDSYR